MRPRSGGNGLLCCGTQGTAAQFAGVPIPENSMKLPLAIILIAVTLSVPTAASAAFKGCYERVYEKSYLKKHRKQDVIKMRFQIGVGKGTDGPFELLDRIDAGFRKKSIYRGNLVECQETGEGLECGIESDGGSFSVIDRGENSIRITNLGEMRFGDEDDGTTIAAKGEHREFRLYRISEDACP
jgi:hypothetical protein